MPASIRFKRKKIFNKPLKILFHPKLSWQEKATMSSPAEKKGKGKVINSNAMIFKLFESFKLLMNVFYCDHLVCVVALKWCCIMGANGASHLDKTKE